MRVSLTVGAMLGALCLLGHGRLCAQEQPADTAPAHPVLRWGGDQEGGGPFIYTEDDDPSRIIGFEVDLAAALGGELERPAEFVQGTWDQLLAMLSRGDLDVVLNGYEYSPERAERYLASVPYYIYELGLAVRQGDESIRGWDDLKRLASGGGRRRVAVLGASAADRFVTDEYGETCTVLRLEGSAEAFRMLENGQIDATVQDLPILEFFINRKRQYPGVEVVGPPAAPGYYVIYARPEDGKLLADVNDAIRELYASGRLRDIYERYGLWNAAQERLPEVWREWDSSLQAPRVGVWRIMRRQAWPLVQAAGVTVALSLLAMPLAIAIGLVVALVRAWDTPALSSRPGTAGWLHRLVRAPCSLYVEVVRGTPLAFQLFVVYFVLPDLGITINAFWAGVIGLAVNYSAYEAEIFRLGLQAIPRGQLEAALSLGMSRTLAIRRIVLPQAVRVVVPATANDFIALFKDTAVCSVIAVQELSKQYAMAAKNTGLFIEMALMASVLYLAMSYPLSLASRWVERRLRGGAVI
ncbi:MAG TPA: ABC transporter permease subunit [Planctomycetaceae bacterium]|nr:ABC transporter permease subunit [Planctomycetaceae bacterium]